MLASAAALEAVELAAGFVAMAERVGIEVGGGEEVEVAVRRALEVGAEEGLGPRLRGRGRARTRCEIRSRGR